ncbi:MAG TPA: HD domain-containing protein [Chloroflexota bacterium]
MSVNGALSRLAERFATAGFQVYLVGGCVRDRLLGRPSADYDLATDAPPDEVKRLLNALPAEHVWTVGERFGTIGAHVDGVTVEITTFRSEEYTPRSRKPAVRFGTTLEGDLARRDLTINAIAEDLRTEALVDPFGGVRDLHACLVRAVGKADERFAEDPLRLLRAVRFVAQLNFRLDPETAAAIGRSADLLADISRERIAQEMDKLLVAPGAAHGLRLLCDLGLMRHIVPEILAMRGMRQDIYRYKDVFEHTLHVVDNIEPELVLRWAALLHDVGKPRTINNVNGETHFFGHEFVGEGMSRRILNRLRYDRALVGRVTHLVAMHQRINNYEGDWTDAAVRRFMREADDALDNLFLLSRADLTTRREDKRRAAIRRLEELRERCDAIRAREDVAKLRSPLDGNDLMALFGQGPGPWIRPIKDRLLDLVVEGELAEDDRATAEGIAREMYAALSAGDSATAERAGNPAGVMAQDQAEDARELPGIAAPPADAAAGQRAAPSAKAR